MRRTRYLVDTSALVRLLHDDGIADEWRLPVRAELLVVCPVVEFELLYSARSKDHRARLVDSLEAAFRWVTTPDRVYDRTADVQEKMSDRGTHRSAGPVDLLAAATAELNDLVLLHYDADFEKVAEVTGQPTSWLAERGIVK